MLHRWNTNLLLAIMLGAAMVLVGCNGADGVEDECPEGQVLDEDGVCVDAPVVCELWEPDCCTRNRNPASPGTNDCFQLSTSTHTAVCDTGTGTCILVCVTHGDCESFYPERCADGVCVCDAGWCGPPDCSSHADCDGQRCVGGTCQDGEVADGCVIAPSPVYTFEGETLGLHAYATKGGEFVVSADDFTWSSDADSVVTIDDSGMATGGAEESAATITATVGSAACTVDVFNYAAIDGDETRVLVLDEVSRMPVPGAVVVVEVGADTVDLVADEEGIAAFAGLEAGAMDVHVFAGQGYSYVSAIGVTGRDLVFFLPNSPSDARTGVRGTLGPQDFAHISGDTIHVALSGMSIPGNFVDLDLNLLVGEMIDTHVQFQSLVDDEIPLPSGLVLGIGDQFFKEWYAPVGVPGKRTAWMLGGNLSIQEVLQVAEPVISGGDLDDIESLIGPALASVLPMFEAFWSGLKPGIDLPAGTEPGTWPPSDFEQVDVALTNPLSLKGVVKLPTLPEFEGKFMEGAIVLGGALVEGQGLVPLGLTAGVDTTDAVANPPDGRVNDEGLPEDDASVGPGQIGLRLAPQHTGIEGSRYAALALAAAFEDLASGSDSRMPLSGYVTTFDSLSFGGAIEFATSAFLGLAEAAKYAAADRVYTPDAVSGADLYRASITGPGGRAWVVYHGGTSAFTLIDPTEYEMEDRASANINAQAVKTPGVDLEALLGFNGTNLDSMMDIVQGFSTIGALEVE